VTTSATHSWMRLIPPQDLLWLAILGAALATSQYGDTFEIAPLVALFVAQILEPKVPATPSTGSRIFWIVLKLALSFILIGYGGGINSRYWLTLLLPVVSAATTFGFVGAMTFTLLTCAAYLAYLPFVTETNPVNVDVELRVVCLIVTGNLANTLAQDLRVQSEKQRRAAEALAEANVHIQQAEQAVRRSDRLAALGQLTAGLAHELRNPLGTIKASAELLQRNVSGENEVSREMAGFIVSEVDRTNSLVTRFLQFARPLQLRRDNADLTQMLDRAIAQVEREAKDAVVYKNYAPEIAPFPFDAELMERVVYNLVLNAVQASPPGGTVSVKTRAAEGAVEIAVIDRGMGIEPRERDAIFNPFFTTKPEGVGMGLAIVAKIVDEHGGKITVESEPGKGSVFHVLLPTNSELPSAPTGSA
jgi:two-component system, NtrC family, sensor histidine kinase HydH